MEDQKPELVRFLEKYGALGTYIIIGLIGKFGFDLVNGKKLSGWYILGTGGMAIFTGWITSVWCASHPTIEAGIVVPIMTLVSRDIILFFMMIDYKNILKKIVGQNIKKDNNESA